MKVLTFLPRCDLKGESPALSSAQFVVEPVVSARECLQLTPLRPLRGCSRRFRFPHLWRYCAPGETLRQENSDACLFVFARYLDLEQRLQLFEAGVDVACASHSFPWARSSSRSIDTLASAAADLAASNTVDILRSGDLELDLVRRKAARLSKTIDLRPKEFLT